MLRRWERLLLDVRPHANAVRLVRGQTRRTYLSAHRRRGVVDFYGADCRRPQRSHFSFLREGDCGLVFANRVRARQRSLRQRITHWIHALNSPRG